MPRKKKDESVEQKETAIAAPETATEEKLETPAKPGRKVIFSSDREKYGEPPLEAQVGLVKIDLPDAEKQLAGFEHEHAAHLVKAVRGYRWLQPKGSKR
jgi:hypothetical protein